MERTLESRLSAQLGEVSWKGNRADGTSELTAGQNPKETPIQASSKEDAVFASFKEIEKGYSFFKDGHVQSIHFHNYLSGHAQVCYVCADVLPSMRKTAPYRLWFASSVMAACMLLIVCALLVFLGCATMYM